MDAKNTNFDLCPIPIAFCHNASHMRIIWSWCSGVTGGGGSLPPWHFSLEIFADLPGKVRQGKKEKWTEKKENCKREGRKFEMEG